MNRRLILLIAIGLILLLVCLLYLWGRRSQQYKMKNQEGLGSWSKSRTPLFLLLALIQILYFLLVTYIWGFQWPLFYLLSLTLAMSLYCYFSGDD